MATERQVAANRRNSQKSTGPRSTAGKKRTSRNSLRHGLSVQNQSNAKRDRFVARLAHKIGSEIANAPTLPYARMVAEAEFDLAQVRQLKIALINRMLISSDLGDRALLAFDRGALTRPEPAATKTGTERARTTLQSSQPDQFADGVRRALPELIKLDRYEQRAATKRRRSLLAILDRTIK
jgi:hypothetical protein